jgi:hypothetical protein
MPAAAPWYAEQVAQYQRQEPPPQPPAPAPYQPPAYGYGAPVAGGGDPGLFYWYPEAGRGLMSMDQYIRDVRAQVPGIAHLPDSLIAYQSIDSLCRMAREEKTAEGKASNKVEVRAHQNLTRLAAAHMEVPASFDNRRDMNHPGRVLPGTVASLQQQWHNARREWCPDGEETLIGYDVMSIGHAGCIMAKGWDALHHPGSYEVLLKFFTIANVARAAKGMKALNAVDEDGFIISDSWRELADISEIKTAMSNLVTAAHLAVPWNFSYKTIEAFLCTTSYMDAELAGLKKAPIVAAFVDHLLHVVNAGYWLSDTNFLDLPAIAEQWRSWWCGQKTGWRPEASSGQNSSQNKQGGQQQGSGGKGGANSKKRTGAPTATVRARVASREAAAARADPAASSAPAARRTGF